MADGDFRLISASGDTIDLNAIAGGASTGVQVQPGLTGLGLPPVEVRYQAGAGDGSTFRGQRFTARDIDLPLYVVGSNRSDLRSHVDRIAKALAGECRLQWEDHSKVWEAKVRRVGGGDYVYGTDTDGRPELHFSVTLRAGDPYWATATPFVAARQGTGLSDTETISWTSDAPGTNLAPNPSFENSSTLFNSSDVNCTSARSTAKFRSGSASIAITSSAAGTVRCGSNMIDGQGRVAITGGTTYTFSAYSQAATTPRSAYVELIWYKADNTMLITATGPSTANTTTGWTRHTLTASAPATAAKVRMVLCFSGATAANEVHYFDSLMLEAKSSASSYFDGDTSDAHAWEGAPHASSSKVLSIEHLGNAPFRPVVKVSGPTLGFTIRHPVTLDEVKYNGFIAEGETITVDFNAGTVVNLAGQNMYPNLSASPRFFSLTPDSASIEVITDRTSSAYTSAESTFAASNHVTNPTFNTNTTGWTLGDSVVVTHDTTNKEIDFAKATIIASRTNLVANPSFESSLVYWRAATPNEILTRNTDPAYVQSGAASLKVTVKSSVSSLNVYGGWGSSEGAPITPGRSYRLGFQARASTTTFVAAAEIAWFSSTGTQIGSTYGNNTTITNTGWTSISVTGQAPSNAAYASVVAYVSAGGSNITTFDAVYLDAFILEDSATYTSYFDGASTDTNSWTYDWLSTESNRSKATRVFSLSSTISGLTVGQEYEALVSLSSIGGAWSTAYKTVYMGTVTVVTGGYSTSTEFSPYASQSVGSPIRVRFTAKATSATLTIQPPYATTPYDAAAATTSAEVVAMSVANVGVVEYGHDYFDGDTLDTTTNTYAWSGTAHASKSTKTSSNDENKSKVELLATARNWLVA